MKSRRTVVSLAAAALALALSATARADPAEGKLLQDLTVGANHDVPLKTGEVVQILHQNGAHTVISLPLPDGSNGIFQIDSTAIQSVPADRDWLEIQFDDDNAIISGANGAPVLNVNGQVVGIFSYGLTGGGHIRGYLIPAALLAKIIHAR